ncbi:STAS domain-containing protein [Neobacillus piezotolerans]|uniref:STAS domain-containing protein n=1 Tax=Neobacillus piezotolerans TaxID=2259171 RepID=A0A3D8GTX1_9BACI|nr:STAS domain-containing protein [Neobacillus piezotolerans]RDU37924.1 STAS domain-containing protein [Neobacillus piezotolerans]
MEDKRALTISGIDLNWDTQKGKLQFQGDDVAMFWISSAMRTFFDTIEEISGEEASNLVFEAAGFRQGMVVGDYFDIYKEMDLEDATKTLSNIYAVAGWGAVEFIDMCYEVKKVTVLIKDGWEYKINLAQGKTKGSNFIPAHFAGVFTSIFGANIWYEVELDQMEGEPYTQINYFPSDITVSENIHQLARKKESELICQLEKAVDEKTKELKTLVEKLSSPVIPVHEGIVVVPLIGNYDEERSEKLLVNTLNKLPSYKANYLILDLTGLDTDAGTYVAILIGKVGAAANLIGTKTILVGVSPKLGKMFAESASDIKKFDFFQTLQHGIHYALGQSGRKII